MPGGHGCGPAQAAAAPENSVLALLSRCEQCLPEAVLNFLVGLVWQWFCRGLRILMHRCTHTLVIWGGGWHDASVPGLTPN